MKGLYNKKNIYIKRKEIKYNQITKSSIACNALFELKARE